MKRGSEYFHMVGDNHVFCVRRSSDGKWSYRGKQQHFIDFIPFHYGDGKYKKY